jgi:hypothetical protein
MPKYIRGDQIPAASDLAKKLDALKTELASLMAIARHHGLHADANALCAARDCIGAVSVSLENKARTAFAAARSGEELPTRATGGQQSHD